MKLNKKTGLFFITATDVVNHSSLIETDLSDKFGEEFTNVVERDLSGMVNRYLLNAYRGPEKEVHGLMIRYLLLTNPKYREGLKEAMVEHTKAAYYSGLDLYAYHENLEKRNYIPEEVKTALHNHEIWRPEAPRFTKQNAENLRNKVDELVEAWRDG